MKRLCVTAALASLLFLAVSCMSGSTSPYAPYQSGDSSVQTEAVLRSVADMAGAITDEDINMLRDVFSDIYALDGNVALRFFTTTTTADIPSATTNAVSFFDSFFQQNENVYCQLTVTNISILGTVATLNVDFGLSALYIMDLPPMTYQSEGSDLMVFVLEDDRWKLTSWQLGSDSEDAESVEQERVLEQLAALALAFADEDLDAAADIAEPGMFLDREVQLRFRTMQTLADDPQPSSDFREFFSTVFVENQNIEAVFDATSVIVLGTQAFVNLNFSLSAVYAGVVPPESYTAGGADEMTFDLISGRWRLALWREKTEPQPGPTAETLRASIASLAQAISDEDLNALQGIASGLYSVDEAVAMRFMTASTLADPPAPSAGVGAFFGEVFAQNQNIGASIDIDTVDLDGAAAYCEVAFSLSATYILEAPPVNYSFPDEGVTVTDIMVWGFDGSSWQLVSWRPKDVPSPDPPPGPTEELLRATIAALAQTINDEDLSTIQGIASDLFSVDETVALRFRTENTLAEPPMPPVEVGAFFDEVFAQNENIVAAINIESLNIDGAVAYCEVAFELSATYTLEAPPAEYSFPEQDSTVVDVMAWVFDGANWRLVGWRQEEMPPPDPPLSPKEELLCATVAAFAQAISDEDLATIQGIASSLFSVDETVALRFMTENTLADPPTPPTDVSAFFGEVFAQNQNISLTMDVDALNINGTVADCEVAFELSATYILNVPPEDYGAAASDIMVWEFDGTNWRLVTWQEVEEPPEE
jgi:hypothetical protein